MKLKKEISVISNPRSLPVTGQDWRGTDPGPVPSSSSATPLKCEHNVVLYRLVEKCMDVNDINKVQILSEVQTSFAKGSDTTQTTTESGLV